MATSFVVIALANILFVLFSCNATNATIGINWGRQTPARMLPSMVVDLLLQNNVKEAKIYNADENVIKAFRGVDIGLTINAYLIDYVSTPERAKDWVERNVVKYDDVKIRYVLVGRSNAFGNARVANQSFFDIVNAVRYVQEALDEARIGNKIKAIISNSYSGLIRDHLVKLNTTRKPSETVLKDDVKEAVAAYVKFAANNGCPFMYEFFPIGYVGFYEIDYNFALTANKSTFIVKDGDLVYRNVFEYAHDSFFWALKKVGAPDNLKFVAGQIGWPTDGFPGANYSTAELYYKELLPLVTSNRGTPMQPGAPIDIYIHSLTDEKVNPTNLPFTRHWGIFRSNGEPKYRIDLSGQGRDIFPIPAKGIDPMPERWCVLDEKLSNSTKVSRVFNETCQSSGDCTSLAPGGSCSILTYHESVSYAFNSFFQTRFQAEDACDFEGLGKITVKNPSRNGCVFIVEVVRGNAKSNGAHIRKFDGMPNLVILVLLTFLLLI